ncbi:MULTISPECIES: hypothetical protein [unclassified Fusobacterium]|uniref:hypothetical protein n=1 Tax=unclassified Fusobacterium TaxID=2648384 RepID=UPI0026388BD8|nr:hypothetical protein [Fusobacterium sp.]
MVKTLVFNILLVITFEVFMFLNGQRKYRGYVTLKHYVLTLKMPIYQKVLMMKILIVSFITIVFKSLL